MNFIAISFSNCITAYLYNKKYPVKTQTHPTKTEYFLPETDLTLLKIIGQWCTKSITYHFRYSIRIKTLKDINPITHT